jgi:uncharacterized protein
MFARAVIGEVEIWVSKPGRKPSIIIGKRPLRKTTVVQRFSEQFDQYIYLNPELADDKAPFRYLLQ